VDRTKGKNADVDVDKSLDTILPVVPNPQRPVSTPVISAAQRATLARRFRVYHHKLNVTVHRRLQEKAPRHLVDCCTPVLEVAGPTLRNSLPDSLHDPAVSSDSFRGNYLKMELHLCMSYKTY